MPALCHGTLPATHLMAQPCNWPSSVGGIHNGSVKMLHDGGVSSRKVMSSILLPMLVHKSHLPLPGWGSMAPEEGRSNFQFSMCYKPVNYADNLFANCQWRVILSECILDPRW